MTPSSSARPDLWAYSNIARAATRQNLQPFLVIWTVARQWLDPQGSGIVSRRELAQVLAAAGIFSRSYVRQLLRDRRALTWFHAGRQVLHLRAVAQVARKLELTDIGRRQALSAPQLAAGRASRRAGILVAALPDTTISQNAVQKETRVSPRTQRRYIAAGLVAARRNCAVLSTAFSRQHARAVASENASRGVYTRGQALMKRLPNTHLQPLPPPPTGGRTRAINRDLRGTQRTSRDLSREKGTVQPARVYFPSGSSYVRHRGPKLGTGQELQHPFGLDVAYIAGHGPRQWTAVGFEIRP
jgi:hypothetical protein